MRSYSPRPELSGIDTSGSARDRYEILGRIASGAMGQVYLARMKRRDRRAKLVVLKRIRPELQLEQGVVEMFYDEARIASQMDHPNIIRIFELGEIDGSLFISMELVQGVNLSGLLRHLVNDSRRLPPPVMLEVALAVLDALDYAHRFAGEDGRPLNIVHRDVSPQNVMISFDGDVKLFDFGVTKAEGRLHKTHPGLLKGKLAYMSPEQIETDRHLDARADLFSLGVMLYEALLFMHPFYGKTDAMVLKAIMDSDPIHPLDLDRSFPPALTEILFTALAKSPDRRFQTARDFADALESYIRAARLATSRQMIADYVRDELNDRIESIERARARGDDDALVTALANTARPKRLESKPPVALPKPRARPMLEPPKPKPRPALPAELPPIPDELGLAMSTTRRYLADSATGDLEPMVPESTQDLPPISRSSVDDILQDALAEGPDAVPVARSESTPASVGMGGYEIRGPVELAGPFRAQLALKRGPRGFARRVVVLRLPPNRRQDTDLVDRLIAIARASCDWTHPALVQTLDFGTSEEPFLITEYVGGQRLDAIVDKARSRDRQVPIAAACRVGADLCAALHHLHERAAPSWVHADLAPEHIWITTDGTVKLGGFAHARPANATAAFDHALSEYAAPEVRAGGSATTRSDVYGVGRILHAMLTSATSDRYDARSRLPSITSLRTGVPDRLVRVIDGCLEPDPKDRESHIAELLEELERTLIEIEQPFTSLRIAEWVSSLYP